MLSGSNKTQKHKMLGRCAPSGTSNCLFTLKMINPLSPIQPRNTPTIDATPPNTMTEPLSGTLIPETPQTEEITLEQEPKTQNIATLLMLLSKAISDVNSIKTSDANITFIGKAKESLEKAKTITMNILKDEE